jgi:hypothetical protein
MEAKAKKTMRAALVTSRPVRAPMMVFAFRYGLSMDYEVFILARDGAPTSEELHAEQHAENEAE